MLPHGRGGLSARRMAVLWTFREPSLCGHVPHALMRNAVLNVTLTIPATTCHQRNYVERYSRCIELHIAENPGGYRSEITEFEVRMNTPSQRTDRFKRVWIVIQISCYGVETPMDSFTFWLCRNSAANGRQCYGSHDADGNDERSGKHTFSPS